MSRHPYLVFSIALGIVSLTQGMASAGAAHFVSVEAGVGTASQYYRVGEDYEQNANIGGVPVLGLGLERIVTSEAAVGLWVHGWCKGADSGFRDPEFRALHVMLKSVWRPVGGPVSVTMGGGLVAMHLERSDEDGRLLEHRGRGWCAAMGLGYRLATVAGRPLDLSYEIRTFNVGADESEQTGETKSHMHTFTIAIPAFSL